MVAFNDDVPSLADDEDAPDCSVGFIAPYDFALDRELWRWVPSSVNLMVTRTPFTPLPVTLDQAEEVSDPEMIRRCTAALHTAAPGVTAFGCTSGSFVGGRAGEQVLREAILGAGAPTAVTTSGAVVEALAHLGTRRVAVATPYDEPLTRRLVSYLREWDVEVTAAEYIGLSMEIWKVRRQTVKDLIRRAATAAPCDAVFVSCTNLSTYDVIAAMEEELGIPVITANQVTMWAALRRLGRMAYGPGQSLLTVPSIADVPVPLEAPAPTETPAEREKPMDGEPHVLC